MQKPKYMIFFNKNGDGAKSLQGSTPTRWLRPRVDLAYIIGDDTFFLYLFLVIFAAELLHDNEILSHHFDFFKSNLYCF